MQPSGETCFAAERAELLPGTHEHILRELVGILSGFATPTEVSSVAVAYAFALAFAYRRGNRALLTETLRETTVTAGMVLFIIAAASPLARS